MRRLFIHPLPENAPVAQLSGSTAVVIDVLRATTVMVEALHAGATEVIPCETISEARQRASAVGDPALLAGRERGGVPIPGFDLGNSPLACTRERVEGRTLVMTTTNGTRALLHAVTADQLLIAGITNLPGVVTRLASEDRDVHVICAGTNGEPTERGYLLLAGPLPPRWPGPHRSIRTATPRLGSANGKRWGVMKGRASGGLNTVSVSQRVGRIWCGWDMTRTFATRPGLGSTPGSPSSLRGPPGVCRLP